MVNIIFHDPDYISSSSDSSPYYSTQVSFSNQESRSTEQLVDERAANKDVSLPTSSSKITTGTRGSLLPKILNVTLRKWMPEYKIKNKKHRYNGGLLLKHLSLKVFKETVLNKATNYFDAQQLLGEGDSGLVYKGSVEGMIDIAIKKAKYLDQDNIEDFLNEADIVSKINHKNIVKLMGVCLESKVPMLVFEFVPNGTLSQHIHDASSSPVSSWPICLKIVAEIAVALHYMHSEADPPMIHRDVKPSNILLDHTYSAKVSDFELAKLTRLDHTVATTNVQGTIGYLDPEYVYTGQLTTKSDVYGFGVVLMELLTKRKPISQGKDGEMISIVQIFASAVEENKIDQVLKVAVANERESEQVRLVAKLAVKCVAWSSTDRPTMTKVANVLNGLRKEYINTSQVEGSCDDGEVVRLLDAQDFVRTKVQFELKQSSRQYLIKNKNHRYNGGLLLKHLSLKVFKETVLNKATNYFDAQQLLGEGDSGLVYKGSVEGMIDIAIKKAKYLDQDNIEDFLNEADIVSKINHRNIVKLMGVCLESKVPMLVFEFVPNGTLSQHIHDASSSPVSSWPICLKIVAEIAVALHYMHSEADPPMIHRDVNPSNILLDHTYSAKVSDFGAAKLIRLDHTVATTRVLGTIGYLDPEYFHTGQLTTKSDVYGFGVVLMELLTKRKPISHEKDGEMISIVQIFASAVEENKIDQVLKVAVANEHESEQVHLVAKLAVRCVSMPSKERPTMTEVADVLNELRKEYSTFQVEGSCNSDEFVSLVDYDEVVSCDNDEFASLVDDDKVVSWIVDDEVVSLIDDEDLVRTEVQFEVEKSSNQ